MPTMQYLHAIYKHKNINNNTYIMEVFLWMAKNKKTEQLQSFTHENEGKEMTTNTGVKISSNENSLTASDRFRTIR